MPTPEEKLKSTICHLSTLKVIFEDVAQSSRPDSRSKVIVPQSSGGQDVVIEPGGVWEWAWQLIDDPENNALVLLASADGPLDADDLRGALLERFPEAAGGDGSGSGLDLSAAAQFLATQAPGSVRFAFKTVETTERCNS